MGILKRKKRREDYESEERFDGNDPFEENDPAEEAADEDEFDYMNESGEDESFDEDGAEAEDESFDEDDAEGEDEFYDEDDAEGEDEFYDEDDSEGEDESYGEDEAEEDVFSLEEDLHRERVRQWAQYLIFAACAVAVVAVALYGSIVLTDRRIEQQKSLVVTPADGSEQPPYGDGELEQGDPMAVFAATPAPVDYWPSSLFPSVPVLESAAYATTVKNGYAQVVVPSGTAKAFNDYIDQLAAKEAQILIRTPRLSVLLLDDVEIHLVNNNLESKVVLCNESEVSWNEEAYAAFVLPDDGKLVDVKEGVGAGSRVLTYREATIVDALAYVSKLMNDGWTISGTLEPANNEFTVVLKKNNLQITLDYFSTGDNYMVKLDYLA